MPTIILKQILPPLITSITRLINESLEKGVFADKWKMAIIKPLIKKAGLELICKNYRPISNLSFLSKILENVCYYSLAPTVQKMTFYWDTN